MSTLIILLDGAADERIPDLGHQTPLQALDKKFMDSLASHGELGCTEARAYTHLFMLEFVSGRQMEVPRGVIEALGYGMKLKEGEVAYRLSPARLNGRRVEWVYGLSCEQDTKLRLAAKRHMAAIEHLNPRINFYCPGKGILTVRSDHVEDFPFPPEDVDLERADFGELDPFIRGMVSANGGMVVMPWGGGRISSEINRKPHPCAKDITFFSKSPSVNGVAALFDLGTNEVSNYKEGFKLALSQLKCNDVFLHIEEIDDISHQKDAMEKMLILEDVDVLLRESAKKLSAHEVALIVDHGTSSLTGQHLVMRVPFAKGSASLSKCSRKFAENEERFIALSQLLPHLLED
ncbi:MAG: hypothetical protein QW520_00385 [Methanomassiliicoccales archaeon]